MMKIFSRRFLQALLALWLVSVACNLASQATYEPEGATMTVNAIIAETMSAIAYLPLTNTPYQPSDTPPPSPSATQSSSAQEPTNTPSASTPANQTVPYLNDRLGGFPVSDLRNGKIGYEHPSVMEPETSAIFTLSIYIPVEFYEVSLSYVITTPSNAPKPIDNDLTQWEGDITVAPQMRVELSSPDFIVNPEFENAKKAIDIVRGNKSTWSWFIKSSEATGVQTLFLQAYLGDAVEPIWEYQIQINVQAPTVTPSFTPSITSTPTTTQTPTATPTQTLTPTPPPIYKEPAFITSVTVAIIGLLSSIIGLFIKYWMDKKKDK